MTPKTQTQAWFLPLLVVFLGVCSVFFAGCRNDAMYSNAVIDRKLIPVLEADTVTTLVSDSGVIQYRVTAAQWQVFDKAEPAYWEFPSGLYLEKFDESLAVKLSIQSNYAHYDCDNEVWLLRGDVHSLNIEGEEFFTPELYWEQKTGRVHSDSSIKIVQKNLILQGVGFESNQSLTQYVILNTTGVFPIDN